MNSKDKPKRGEAKPFVRETKPRAEGKTASKPGAKSSAPAKTRAKADAAPKKQVRSAKREEFATETSSAAGEGKPERISKILARAGVASRRDIERMILDGRVTLNGKVLDTPVINVTLEDKIEVDGAPIRGIERTRLWLYHKPGGLVTTNSDPEGRPTVFDNLPEGLPRVLSIGRLDINTEGLLLLTNDGGLSRTLELPTTGWLRRYRVRAHGEVDQEALDKLKDGIAVDGVLYGSIEATLDRSQGRNVWITMGLREGKNREIKNVLGALGLEVNRLIRISYGPFQLGDLPEGEALEVRGRTLRDQLGPRLIDEAKANFEAPLYNERDAEDEKPQRAEKAERGWAGDRGDRGNDRGNDRGDNRGDRRERALGRLDTKRDDRKFGGKPAGKFGDAARDRDFGEDKPKKRPPMGTSRTANVWMAPGARPTTDDKGRKTSARAEAEQLFKKPSPENDRRVVVNRAADDEGDWIRADGPDKPDKGGFGGKRGFGDREGRGERSDRGFGDKPRGERSFGDKPRGERSYGERSFGDRKPREDGDRPARGKSFSSEGRSERPRAEGRGEGGFRDRPRGDGPRGDRGFGDKPRGERSSGERSFGDRRPRQDGDRPARSFAGGEGRSERPRGEGRGERSFSDRPPRGDRPARDDSRGERGFGDRPARGDRPFGGKPSGSKSGFGGKPGGSKGFGGKPGGGGSRGGAGGGKPGGRPAGGGGRPGGRPAGKPRTPRG
jgi:23S rRNA pseudouridine2605 synthase